jgi:hypothetical protein
MPTLKLQWPTRKTWANHQTAGVFYDANNPYTPIPKLSAYAGEQEIAGAIEALKTQYRDLGRDLRQANLEAGPDLRQEGVGAVEYYQWCAQLRDEERHQRLSRIWRLQRHRQEIKEVLRQMAAGGLPRLHSEYEWCAEIGVIRERYDAADKAASERWRSETKEKLVGDAAWRRELARRAEIAKAGNPDFDRLLRVWAQHDREPGPRLGDFLRVDGGYMRITGVYRGELRARTPRIDSIGNESPSYYFSEGRACAAAGGADGERYAVQDAVTTSEVRDGAFTAFHRAIAFAAPCRVFELQETTP